MLYHSLDVNQRGQIYSNVTITSKLSYANPLAMTDAAEVYSGRSIPGRPLADAVAIGISRISRRERTEKNPFPIDRETTS
jgi:hypothetical protein